MGKFTRTEAKIQLLFVYTAQHPIVESTETNSPSSNPAKHT